LGDTHRVNPRERFEQLVSRPDEAIPLAETALWIAAEAKPDLDVPHYLDEIDKLAQLAEASLVGANGDEDRIARFNHALFVEAGFEGNQESYDDPRNSFLDVVLDRRTGIPITLSVVYIEVARKVGFDAEGIGFPGHFLSKITTPSGMIVVDPFFGRTMDLEACHQRFREVAGPNVPFDPQFLASSSQRAILQRILTNLRQIYMARRDFEAALACSDRILIVAPGQATEYRDRGLIHSELECFNAALEDIERYLELAPIESVDPAIGVVLSQLREKAALVH
jgi:regulator of sirC expression with transglutaminase-like and TPR domain